MRSARTPPNPRSRQRDPELAVAQTSSSTPTIVMFESAHSGQCRKIDAFLAAILQRRRNHGTFSVSRVDVDKRPDLAERFHVTCVPTLLVVDQGRICARLERPRGVPEITRMLTPWLR